MKNLRKSIRVSIVASTALLLGILPASVVFADGVGALGNQVPGTVLFRTSATVPPELQGLATAQRIKYVSTDPSGNKVPVTGLIFTPTAPSGGGEIVAWGHGTAGIADICAPSVNSEVFYPEAVDAIKTYLNKGWTVTATDYAGLGSDGEHPYLNGNSEGRAIIDSVRAARNLNSNLSTKWATVGHSQGGQAALFAGEIAGTYGQGLNLTGVIGLATASNIERLATAIPGTDANGYLVIALYGLASLDPTVHPEQLLAQPALDRVDTIYTNCGDVAINDAFSDLTADQLLVGGQLPQWILDKFATTGNPAQQPSTVPVLLAQGSLDTVIPLQITQLLQSQECAIGSQSFFKVFGGQDHIGVVFSSKNAVLNFIQDRFDGVTPVGFC